MRALITREHAEPLATHLSRHGLAPVHLPLLVLCPRPDPPPATPCRECLVTSASVVRLSARAVAWMADKRVVAVGHATARALHGAGVTVAAVGQGTGQQALELVSDGAVFIGAAKPAQHVEDTVRQGVLTHWAVYDRRMPEHTPHRARSLPDLSVVTLASPSAARSWARLDVQRAVPTVVIGPTTEAAALDAGLGVVARANRPSLAALAEAAARATGRWRG